MLLATLTQAPNTNPTQGQGGLATEAPGGAPVFSSRPKVPSRPPSKAPATRPNTPSSNPAAPLDDEGNGSAPVVSFGPKMPTRPPVKAPTFFNNATIIPPEGVGANATNVGENEMATDSDHSFVNETSDSPSIVPTYATSSSPSSSPSLRPISLEPSTRPSILPTTRPSISEDTSGSTSNFNGAATSSSSSSSVFGRVSACSLAMAFVVLVLSGWC
jgi:hypothetical protein